MCLLYGRRRIAELELTSVLFAHQYFGQVICAILADDVRQKRVSRLYQPEKVSSTEQVADSK